MLADKGGILWVPGRASFCVLKGSFLMELYCHSGWPGKCSLGGHFEPFCVTVKGQ